MRHPCRLIIVVGTRPNLVKAAPVYKALVRLPGVQVRFAHTGQHHDPHMDSEVAESLGLPKPDWQGKTYETGYDQARKWLADIFRAERPEAVIVLGDVDSTYYAACAARDAGCTLAHVESGLRSGDLSMPEERNRIAVDRIADLLLATEPAGVENLEREEVMGRIELVGSCTVDALHHQLGIADRSNVLNEMGLEAGKYILVTVHRQANVDDPEKLTQIIALLARAAEHTGHRIVWPIHPRTVKRLGEYDIAIPDAHFKICDPVDYTRFTKLMKDAAIVITDSGGIQEETTYLGVRCITLRDTTERPVTIERGTNDLLPDLTADGLVRLLDAPKPGQPIQYWDGQASVRAALKILEYLAEAEGRGQ